MKRYRKIKIIEKLSKKNEDVSFTGGDTLTCLNKTELEEGCLLRVAFKANPWNGRDNIKWSLSDPKGQSVPFQLTNIESLQNSDEHMATLETSEVVQDGSILNLNFQVQGRGVKKIFR